MKIKSQDYDDVTVIELQGDLDSDFTEAFQKSICDIIAGGKVGIVLDMSEVTFIDSEGLEQLLWVRDYCNEHHRHLRLAGLDEICTKILEVTRLQNQFDCYKEPAEAVKSFV